MVSACHTVDVTSSASPRYPIVLFDLDHTLFDFDGSKAVAFGHTVKDQGYDNVDELKAVLSAQEAPLWRQVEAGTMDLADLNGARFEALVKVAGLNADAAVMADTYVHWLGRSGGLLPGARDILDALHPHCTLGLITNGYGEVQRPRLEIFDLAKYFDSVVISGEIGVAKPNPAFFEPAFEHLGQPDRSDILVVGDSLSSDMAGGIATGLDTCWFNPTRKERPVDMALDFVVDDLAQIAAIVL